MGLVIECRWGKAAVKNAASSVVLKNCVETGAIH